MIPRPTQTETRALAYSWPTIPIELTQEEQALFWENVDQSGGANACWPWLKARYATGYGAWAIRGRAVKAHRVALTLATGPIPDGMFACHQCDNPPCCNPAHLFAGTSEDNIRDRNVKGRTAQGNQTGPGRYPEKYRGENHGQSRLTDDDVREIRRRLDEGETETELRAAFGISCSHMSRIALGLSWTHLNTPKEKERAERFRSKGQDGENNNFALLTWESVRAIRARYAAGGITQKELGAQFGVSKGAVNNIIRGTTWKDVPALCDGAGRVSDILASQYARLESCE